MLEQQVRSTVQPHGGLAGTRAALHHEALVDGSTDDHVLFGLDGGHDLAHRAGTRRTDFGQHRVRHAAGRSSGIGVVELFVEVCRNGAVGQREATAVHQAQRVDAGGAVEGRCHRRTPVDHHRVVAGIFDVAAADVPGGRRGAPRCLLGDAAEEVTGPRCTQIVECLGHSELHVGLGVLVGGGIGVDVRVMLDHGVAARTGVGQLCLLGGQFGKRIVECHGCTTLCGPLA